MANVWIVSDTHFGHANIIKYCDRPFADADEMDAALIKNWNSKIKKDDKVFHLGDVIMGKGAKEKLKEIIPKLNGNIHLIKGNHDNFSNQVYLDAGFKTVSEYPIIYAGFYILSHEPVFINETMPYLNIHGHTHQNDYGGKGYFNASLEKTNYMPIAFEDIVKEVSND